MLKFVLFSLLAVFSLGKTPEKVSVKITEQLLSTDPMSYAPEGFRGRKTPYGNNNHVQYSVVSLWVYALQCAELRGDADLEKRLLDLYEPFASGIRRSLPPEHVDYSIYGALPLEVYLHNGDPRALKIGLSYADAEWEEPLEGKVSEAHGNFPWAKQHELWDEGLSAQARLWIDDLYMITLLQVQAFRATGDKKYLDRAVRTMKYYLPLVMQENGLCYHAPDVPYVWGRGMGWVAAGLTLLLENMEEKNSDRDLFLQYYRTMTSTLLSCQRKNGFWGQLVLDPESWDESSCTAMFAWSLAVGINHGWLDTKTCRRAVKKAWKALVGKVDVNGNLGGICDGTDRRNSREWYMGRGQSTGDPHGQAPLMWLAQELIKIEKK